MRVAAPTCRACRYCFSRLTACPWHAVDLPQASLRDALPHDGPWRPLAVHMGVVVVHNGCSYWSRSTRTFPLGPRMALAAHMRVLCVCCTAFVYNSTITTHILTQRAKCGLPSADLAFRIRCTSPRPGPPTSATFRRSRFNSLDGPYEVASKRYRSTVTSWLSTATSWLAPPTVLPLSNAMATA